MTREQRVEEALIKLLGEDRREEVEKAVNLDYGPFGVDSSLPASVALHLDPKTYEESIAIQNEVKRVIAEVLEEESNA